MKIAQAMLAMLLVIAFVLCCLWFRTTLMKQPEEGVGQKHTSHGQIRR